MSFSTTLLTLKKAHHSTTPQHHPCAPEGVLPGQTGSSQQEAFVNTNSIQPKEGEAFSRSQLSKRFQYTFPKEIEIDDIISGGAEVVF